MHALNRPAKAFFWDDFIISSEVQEHNRGKVGFDSNITCSCPLWKRPAQPCSGMNNRKRAE